MRARQLDPFLPAYCRELEAVAYYLLGQYADTVAVVAQLSRVTRIAAVYRVAAYTHLDDPGGLDNAKNALRIIDPDFTIQRFVATEFYKDPCLVQQLRDDLCKAGLKAE